jgi:nucleoside-diphosphate-sugar epimerase
MKILVIGATGYIGSALADALNADEYEVTGLARSEASFAGIRSRGLRAIAGDLRDPPSLARAVLEADPDMVVCTASAGGGAGDARAFRADREAIVALARALAGRGKTLIFTSGSAVFGTFADGERSDRVFDEATRLPLPTAVFAPARANVPARFVEELRDAVAPRVEAERALLESDGLRGMVVRPGNVYGYGGSVDIPKHIEMARAHGVAPHLAAGGTTHGTVHLDDLVSLYRRVIERGVHGGVYHAVAEEVSQRDLARAISRMIGAGDRSASLTLEQMHALGGTRGVRLSVNKRLSADRTRRELGWAPIRADTLHDVEFGSYARR